jgi:hypothetical protein
MSTPQINTNLFSTGLPLLAAPTPLSAAERLRKSLQNKMNIVRMLHSRIATLRASGNPEDPNLKTQLNQCVRILNATNRDIVAINFRLLTATNQSDSHKRGRDIPSSRPQDQLPARQVFIGGPETYPHQEHLVPLTVQDVSPSASTAPANTASSSSSSSAAAHTETNPPLKKARIRTEADGIFQLLDEKLDSIRPKLANILYNNPGKLIPPTKAAKVVSEAKLGTNFACKQALTHLFTLSISKDALKDSIVEIMDRGATLYTTINELEKNFDITDNRSLQEPLLFHHRELDEKTDEPFATALLEKYRKQ